MDRTSLPIKLQPSNLRPIAYRILSKKHGLNIQTDGLKLLTDIISYKFGVDWRGTQSQLYLEDIAKAWKSLDRGLFIDNEGLKEIVKQLSNEETKQREIVVDADEDKENVDTNELNWQDYFKIINPDQQPNYKFDKQRKQFSLVNESKSLKSFLQGNIEYFNNRYYLIMDRLSRNENFQRKNYTSISNIMKKEMNNEITLIKNIIGRDGSKFILFGLLLKNSLGNYVLEDASDFIELNFDQAIKTEGSFYNIGMFVIVEGIYSQYNGNNRGSALEKNLIGGVFYVSNIGQPPAEKRDSSLENYGNLDFLNINNENLKSLNHISKINKNFKKKLIGLEKQLTNNKLLIFGSDTFLDNLVTLQGFKKIFNKLESAIVNEDDEEIPIGIVLMGSFISKAINSMHSSVSTISNSESYKNNFDSFTNLLSGYPNIIQRIKFIIIPGANDPWQSTHSLGSSNLNYFPQSSIPNLFVNRLERLLPKGNLVIGWNPIRISYLNQEIVIMKEDIMSKFKRNDIIFDSDKNHQESDDQIVSSNSGDNISPKLKQARKLVKTLLDQGHLQPFSKQLKLTNPIYDNSLRLEPLPSVLIISDCSFENFDITYNGCKVVNITHAIKGRRLNYVEYTPSNKKVSFKELYF